MHSLAKIWIVGAACVVAAAAQTHVVKRPETVVRAVGVYEWTGEEGKATASRFVPVSVFINGQLEDGGVYLARPVPFELGVGTVFDLERAGASQGSLEIAYARHLESSGNGSYDDGWIAVGAYKARPAEEVAVLKPGPVGKIEVSGGSGPHFSNQPAAQQNTAARTPVDRSGAASGGTVVSADTDSRAAGDDPVERPTLKRHTPEQTKAANKTKDQASVSGVGELNEDPDRPNLHRGKPVTRMEEEDLPPLKGVPSDMHQRVGVSDAKDRPDHDFTRAFQDDAERAEVTARMHELAGAQLAAYSGKAAPAPAPARAPAPAQRTPGVRPRRPAATPAPAPPAFSDEVLRGYTLSYGGAATYAYAATAQGPDGVARYVSIVAQREPLGTLKVAMANVTDAAHLDRTPWFRLVDAVDVEASNRASLLFELRGQTTRQFALYRVIGAEATQTFVTSAQ